MKRAVMILSLALLAGLVGPSASAGDCQVTNSNDSGAGSLRDCIDNVATNDGDGITFAPSVTSPILLTSGELHVVHSIRIQGSGEDVTVLDGSGNSDRVLHVDDFDILVEISGVTIKGGTATSSGNGGGGIFVEHGSLNLTDSTVTNNKASGGGGGIFVGSGSSLNLVNVQITGNQALAPSGGGGLFSNGGLVDIRGGTISGNTVAPDAGTDDRGGGFFQNNSGFAVIDGTLIQGNTADGDGGGIVNDSGSMEIRFSRIDDNTSVTERGGGVQNFDLMTISDSEITNNDVPVSGGGLDAVSGVMIVEDSLISGNTAVGDAGGISTQSTLIVRRSRILDNTADSDSSGGNAGGGFDLSGGTVTIEDCLVSGNKALGSTSEGGGISISGAGPVFVFNTTVFDNESGGAGGGVTLFGEATLNNMTIVGNRSGDQGGGLFNDGTALFKNSIFAGNSASNQGPDCFDNSGDLISDGPNLIQNTADCTFAGPAAITGDPLLGPLADNGGGTQTLSLLAGSPALEAGDDTTCEAADQRGTARPQGAHCDLGAFEAGPSSDLSAAQLVFDAQEISTESAAQTVTLTNHGAVALTFNGLTLSGPNAADFAESDDCGGSVAPGASCNLSFTFTPSAPGVRQAEAAVATSANVGTISLLGAGVAGGNDGGTTGGDTAGGGGNSGGGCSLIR